MAGEETIVALATPPGTGALAVVRMSGPDAIPIADRIFRGARALADSASHRVHLGWVCHPATAERLDQVLATVMRAPRTHTGEDVVELSGHGGRLIGQRVLEAALAAGARSAAPGEFTRRAFLNGRIDLAQAEAVADLIHARGERAARNAMSQLQGGLSSRIGALRSRLLDMLAPLEAFIDFGDDVPEPPGMEDLGAGVAEVAAGIDRLLAGRERGRLLSDGATVALVGRPNVGKSSLLNALSGQDRAIVHHQPGTTRDILDVEIEIEGIPVRLIDTAGLRATPDPVEAAGVERARRAQSTADVTLLVLDGSEPPTADDRAAAALLTDRVSLITLNKSDIGAAPSCREWASSLGSRVVTISATRGAGLDGLIQQISQVVATSAGDDEGFVMTRARHYDALRRGREALERAGAALHEGAFADMLAAELRESLAALGEITGEAAGPDLLDRIFSTFCIGK